MDAFADRNLAADAVKHDEKIVTLNNFIATDRESNLSSYKYEVNSDLCMVI